MLPRRDLDPRTLLAGIDPSLRDARLRELGEGFDNVAFAVDEQLVLRVSKIADPQLRARTAERDIALAHFAGRHSTLPTGRIVGADVERGALLATLIAGAGADLRTPRLDAEFVETLAGFLARLAAAPASEVAEVVERPTISATAWLEQTIDLYEGAAPQLPVGDRRPIEQFLAEPVRAADDRDVFSHNDLGDEHLIVGADRRLAGVIDWSDAVLGDPARDLALLMLDLGPDVAERIAERIAGRIAGRGDGDDPDLLVRARWWAMRAGVEGVAWRVSNGRPWHESLRRLRRLLAG